MTFSFQDWNVAQIRDLMRKLKRRDWMWKDNRCSTRVNKQHMIGCLYEWRPCAKKSQRFQCYRNERLKLEFYRLVVGKEQFLFEDSDGYRML